MNSSITWSGDLLPRLLAAKALMHARMSALMSREASSVQNYARSNAPWTDRTGNARNGLFAKASSSPTSYEITLYHTVPYGIWLEVKHSGRYAIIEPTIAAEGRRIMGNVKSVMAAL